MTPGRLAAVTAGSLALLAGTASGANLDAIAERYLVLELAMGRHDPAHVDAYFGPEALREQAEAEGLDLAQIASAAQALDAELAAHPTAGPASAERIKGLRERLLALDTRTRMARGERLPFDEESRLLFGAVAPLHDAAFFQQVLDRIDVLLPGEGALEARVTAFRAGFVIPVDRLAAVFDAAIAECRRRTVAQLDLPDDESFTVEYVTDKPWSGYNWYQGRFCSLIQVNTELPIYIERAVDLGCHEGYPGHHVYNLLLERELVIGRGWQEFTLYPLFSPESLIAEGSANYGRELAIPAKERMAFEKEVLFPLAGLDPAQADLYYAFLELTEQLDHAGNVAARGYLDGKLDAGQAQAWLQRYALSSPEKAAQRLRFFDAYRSYVINYNLGRDLVRDWVERGNADTDERWRRFELLLSTPMSAADLR